MASFEFSTDHGTHFPGGLRAGKPLRKEQSPDLLLGKKRDLQTKMLSIVVQPPRHARVGVAMYPPVVATLNSEMDIFDGLSRVWAVATLIYYSGDVLENQLGGRLSDSAHPMPRRAPGNRSGGRGGNRERAYFCFPDLAIYEPGEYWIRVTVMRMDSTSPDGSVVVEEQVDTQSVVVEDRDPGRARLSSDERAYIKALREDGQEIPSPRS